jgi:ABC-2 type transport system ATP-binding protein
MSAALEVQGITRRFGRLTAVEALSFAVEPGRIVGFIGPNGAGKTTTMRICATLDLPDEGDVLVDGVSVIEEPRRARQRLGFMPDSYGAYSHTVVSEYLDFYARAYGLHGRERARALRHVMEFTALTPLADKELTALSKGMKQRLCLAKTLLHDPPLFVLDEPAAGLDPRARVELRELVKALAELGKAILISSHILTELSEMVDGVVVIEQGRLRASGTVGEVLRGSRATTAVYVRALAERDAVEKALLELPGVLGVRRKGVGLVFELQGGDHELARVLAELVRRDLRPIEYAPRDTNLEDAFLSLTEGRVQ